MLMELFRLLGKIAIDNTEANNALDDTAQKANDSANEAESAFGKIGSAAQTLALGIGAAGLAIGGAFVGAVEGTREYRQQMGLLDSAFQTAGHSSDAAKDTYSELNAILGDSGQAVEASQHLAKLVDNEEDLSTWTDICAGVYSTFGESIPLESLAESANEVAKSGELTGGLVDALVWAGIGEEEFQAKLDKCTTEQERQKLIMDTLNGTYSEASEQYKKTNKDIMESRKAQERLSDAIAEVGRVGEPVMTAIRNAIASMAEKAVPVIENMVNGFRDCVTWVKANQDTVHAWIGVIIGATTAIGTFLLIISWGKIMTAAANAIKVVRTAMLALNAAMLANPVALIIAVLAGLVAAFLYLWKNCDGFRAFWLKLWDKVKSASSSAVSWISGKFDSLKGAIDKAKTKFNEVQKTISDKMDAAQKAVKKAIDKIKGFFDFKWSFPKLKMPTIGIKGKFSIDPPSAPKFTIKWNAEGGVLTKPAIFGAVGNTLLGGGEAGHEAIAPIDVLQDYVREAVRGENNLIVSALIEQNGILMDFLAKFMPTQVYLDSGVLVGELASGIDARLGAKYKHIQRGNTR